jgi:hypothetical protein
VVAGGHPDNRRPDSGGLRRHTLSSMEGWRAEGRSNSMPLSRRFIPSVTNFVVSIVVITGILSVIAPDAITTLNDRHRLDWTQNWTTSPLFRFRQLDRTPVKYGAPSRM